MVHATDLGSDSRYFVESNLLISLTDVDDESPVIDSIDCPCFIRENISASAECSPLSAQDKDSTSIQFLGMISDCSELTLLVELFQQHRC